MNSEKSTNSFDVKKSYLIIYWKIFFHEFVHNFSALLLHGINYLDIFNLLGSALFPDKNIFFFQVSYVFPHIIFWKI